MKDSRRTKRATKTSAHTSWHSNSKTLMNSPPEELSPSPSSPSSSSPPPEEVSSQTASQIASSYLSPNQTKRRLPSSSSAHIIAREGRENKSRRKEVEKEREDVLKLVRGSAWESRGEYVAALKAKDDLVDMHVVEHMRKVYGDPLSKD